MPDGTASPPTLAAPRRTAPQTVGELLQREEEMTKRLSAIAGKYLPAERAMRLGIMAVRRTPKLAACDPTSFFGALMAATGLGLEPNTPKGHAFLIPYEQRKPRRDQNGTIQKDGSGKWIWDKYYECQFQVGYKGFVALFYRNPIIRSVKAEAIYVGDKFEHRIGTETFLRYEKALANRGTELVGSFCFTELKDGQSFTVLPADEIYKLRSRSQTWRSLTDNVDDLQRDLRENDTPKVRRDLEKAQRILAETPWVMWEGEMASKSSIRRHAKQQDLGDDGGQVSIAADLDALNDSGAVDIRSMADPDFAKEVVAGNEPLEVQGEDDGQTDVDPETGEIRETNSGGAGQSQSETKTDEKPGETANSPAARDPTPKQDAGQTERAPKQPVERKGLF